MEGRDGKEGRKSIKEVRNKGRKIKEGTREGRWRKGGR
jgi:hypothetical protein